MLLQHSAWTLQLLKSPQPNRPNSLGPKVVKVLLNLKKSLSETPNIDNTFEAKLGNYACIRNRPVETAL